MIEFNFNFPRQSAKSARTMPLSPLRAGGVSFTLKQPLLLQEPPLQVLPSLAEAIGLNEAIVLQQLHFLLYNPENGRVLDDGQRYIYNTYEEWRKYFKFWSCPTIKRIFLDLEERKLVISKQPEGNTSRRKYYRIGQETRENLTFEALAERTNSSDEGINLILSMDQVDPLNGSSCALPLIAKTSAETSQRYGLTAEKTKKTRNVLFDSLCLAEGSNPDEIGPKGGMVAKALKEICLVSPDVTPQEIASRAVNYRREWPSVTLTCTALAKHWARLGGAGNARRLTDAERYAPGRPML